jgi:hypothetical protein
MINVMQIIVFIFGLLLIVARGFWPNIFMVDAFSILILFVISIPLFANYLRRAKFPGAEFEFKEEIKETRKLVEISTEQAKSLYASTNHEAAEKYETFRLERVIEIFEEDPILALAGLRIEIEKKLRLAVEFLGLSSEQNKGITHYIKVLRQYKYLSDEQAEALSRITRMCNKAVHGGRITVQEAREIIKLADELNQSFAIGYSIDFSPNLDFERHGLLCEWEHCIEHMPLEEEPTELSCKVFGHNCPGGLNKTAVCKKEISDIPRKRFVATKLAKELIKGKTISKSHNLESIRQQYPRAYERWADDEDARLKDRYSEGLSMQRLSEMFQR